MVNYQIVGIGGNLTRKVELFGEAKNVAKFSVAVNSGFGEHKKTAFVNCVSFQKSFHPKGWELLTGLDKGANLGVKGEFVTESYENKEGKKVSSLSLIVREFQMYGPKPEAGETGAAPVADKAKKVTTPVDDDDNQIPF